MKKVQVRFSLGGRVINGKAVFPKTIPAGRSGLVKVRVPKKVYKQLAKGRKSGTVIAVVNVASSNATKGANDIRTGLMR